MNENFRIVVFPPMGQAYSTLIAGSPAIEPAGSPMVTSSLDGMQAVVGGIIECLYDLGHSDLADSGREIDFWCNDEFLYLPDMVFNRVVDYSVPTPIMGPMFACASTPEDGESRGLSEEEALALLVSSPLKHPQLIAPSEKGTIVNVICDGGGREYVDFLRDLPDAVKEMNRLPIDGASFDRLVPAPLVGKPQEMVSGDWLARIVYRDDLSHVGSCPRHHESPIPLVELYDLSERSTEQPEGRFAGAAWLDGEIRRWHPGGTPSLSLPELCRSVGIGAGNFEVLGQFIGQARETWEMEGREMESGGRAPDLAELESQLGDQADRPGDPDRPRSGEER